MKSWSLTLLLPLLLHAQILEIDRFEDISQYVQSDSLIILDVDDTLIKPTQSLGSTAWVDWQAERYMKMGFSRVEAFNQFLPHWYALQFLTDVVLVEPSIADTVLELQQTNRVIALTARGLSMATCTCDQLATVGIDFSHNALGTHDQFLDLNERSAIYRGGVLCSSGHPKGLSLFHLCDQAGYTPTHIIAVDDTKRCLDELESESLKRGVPFIGLRYSGADQDKASFSPEIAEKQWRESRLHHLLSDQEALEH